MQTNPLREIDIAKATRQEKRFPNYHSMALRVYQLIEREGEEILG